MDASLLDMLKEQALEHSMKVMDQSIKEIGRMI